MPFLGPHCLLLALPGVSRSTADLSFCCISLVLAVALALLVTPTPCHPKVSIKCPPCVRHRREDSEHGSHGLCELAAYRRINKNKQLQATFVPFTQDFVLPRCLASLPHQLLTVPGFAVAVSQGYSLGPRLTLFFLCGPVSSGSSLHVTAPSMCSLHTPQPVAS